MRPGRASTREVALGGPYAERMDVERLQTVVLAGGRSTRMGFDKLTAPFAGEPLARRVANALCALGPLFVAVPAVAEAIDGVPNVRVLVTAPTAGPAETLSLAHAAVPPDAWLAVLPCDLPFIDAQRVIAIALRVDPESDLAWPVVAQTPGHPVLWSPAARARIPRLRTVDAPLRVRDDPALRTEELASDDDAFITDVDTPESWARAETRARTAR